MAFRLLTPSRKWQDITSLATVPVTSGRVLFQRDGHQRTIVLDQLLFAAAGSGTFLVIPAELGRPAFIESQNMRGLTVGLQLTQWGNAQGFNWDAGTPVRGRLTYSVEGVA